MGWSKKKAGERKKLLSHDHFGGNIEAAWLSLIHSHIYVEWPGAPGRVICPGWDVFVQNQPRYNELGLAYEVGMESWGWMYSCPLSTAARSVLLLVLQ